MKRTQNITIPVLTVNGSLSLDVESTPEYKTLAASFNAALKREQDNLSRALAAEAELKKLKVTPKVRAQVDVVNPSTPPNIPEGFRYVGFRLPKMGERFENQPGVFQVAQFDFKMERCHIIEPISTARLSRLDMQMRGMSKAERHEQYQRQGGGHPDDTTDVRLSELPDGFRLESKTPKVHNRFGSIRTAYYWFDETAAEWVRGSSDGNIGDLPVYVALPKE